MIIKPDSGVKRLFGEGDWLPPDELDRRTKRWQVRAAVLTQPAVRDEAGVGPPLDLRKKKMGKELPSPITVRSGVDQSR